MSLNVAVIRSSFEMVKPIAEEAVSYFYDTLFNSYPESKNIFYHVDMDRQKKILFNSLVKIIDGLDHLETLGCNLRGLGGRHLGFGLHEGHYSMVGKSLISTFRHFFKERWTPELEDQWIMALGFIADQLLEGAKQATAAAAIPVGTPVVSMAPNYGKKAAEEKAATEKTENYDLPHVIRQIARSVLLKAMEDELTGDLRNVAKKKATHLLTQAIREEADHVQTVFDESKKRTATA